MPFVAQGATTVPADTSVMVRATPNGPLVDPDAGTLSLAIHNPNGLLVLSVAEAGLARLSIGRWAFAWTPAIDALVGSYAWLWNGSVNGVVLPTAVDEVEVIPAGTLVTTLVSPAQVRALMDTPITDEQLSAIIAREQSVLELAVGPLTGARVEVVIVGLGDSDQPVSLARRTSTISVLVDGQATTDFRLGSDGRTIRPLSASGWSPGFWSGVLEVLYTPNDLAIVEAWLIELVRARLAATGFAAESMDGYSYQAGKSAAMVLASAQRAILRRRGITSLPLSTVYSIGTWVGTTRPA